jgi:hypothetical protein
MVPPGTTLTVFPKLLRAFLTHADDAGAGTVAGAVAGKDTNDDE